MKSTLLIILLSSSMIYSLKLGYYPSCSRKFTSLEKALDSMGVDSSYLYKKKIANMNAMDNYDGSYKQNLKLLNLLKKGRLIKYIEEDPEPEEEYLEEIELEYDVEVEYDYEELKHEEDIKYYYDDIKDLEAEECDHYEEIEYEYELEKTSSTQEMMRNLLHSSEFPLKRQVIQIIGYLLFDTSYPPSFIAGVLANIYDGGIIGKFESSAYISNPYEEPQYLKYMDMYYDYRNKYSGKIVTDVSMKELGQLLVKLRRSNWNRGKFGLGCFQWTEERTLTLYKFYQQECRYQDKITTEQATSAEGKMIIKELEGDYYRKVYQKWEEQNRDNYSSSAAYNAGVIVCTEYANPADNKKARVRGYIAREMYEIMIDGVY